LSITPFSLFKGKEKKEDPKVIESTSLFKAASFTDRGNTKEPFLAEKKGER
jgi:hypothetical protein